MYTALKKKRVPFVLFLWGMLRGWSYIVSCFKISSRDWREGSVVTVAALPGDPGLVPNTPARWLTIICDSRVPKPRPPRTLNLRAHAHEQIPTPKHN